MRFLFKGIKFKMTSALIASVLGTAVVLTVITSLLVSYTLRLSLKSQAQATAKIVEEALGGRKRQLAIRGDILAQDGDFQTKYSFRESEPQGLKDALVAGLQKINAQQGLVVDMQNQAACTASAAGDKGDPTALLNTIALQQARDTNKDATTIEAVNGKLYFVATVPLLRYNVQTLGFLVVASPFDAAVADQLKSAAGAEIILARDGVVQASTAALDKGQDTLKSAEQGLDKAQEVVPVDGLATSETSLLANALPLRAGNKVQGILIFALSAHDANALQKRLLRSSLLLSLLTMVLAGVVGFLIARRISDPIVEIERSFREIAASGDLSRRIDRPYSDEIGLMADSFNQMQGQIETLHNRVVTAEQRMREELKMASAVQSMLLATGVVDGARAQFASYAQTSTEIGGDWFTIMHAPELDTTINVVADVTGHGAPAALVTAILHGFFGACRNELLLASKTASWEEEIGAILRRLNKTVIDSTQGALTHSLFFIAFDHRTLKARYLNAGHISPLLIKNESGTAQVGSITTPASSLIGDVPNPDFATGEVQLAPDQMLITFTDGLVECTNMGGEMYGYRRLRRLVQSVGHQDARTVRDLMVRDAMGFFGDKAQDDDITIVVARVR